MYSYTIELIVPIMGVDTITIEQSEDFEVGQEISLPLYSRHTILGLSGLVTLEPGEIISGTVVGKK